MSNELVPRMTPSSERALSDAVESCIADGVDVQHFLEAVRLLWGSVLDEKLRWDNKAFVAAVKEAGR